MNSAAAAPERRVPTRIYVRAPNWVGDLVMATSAFARLRAAYRDAEIVCGLRPYLQPLLAGADYFDDFLPMPPAGGPRGLWRQVRAVRQRRFDLAVVLPNSIETGLVPWLARVPLRLGYRQGRPGLMNFGVRAPRGRPWYRRSGSRRVPTPMPEYYAELLDCLDIPRTDLRPSLTVTDEEDRAWHEWRREHAIAGDVKLAMLNAGASYGGSKLWEPDRFAALARRMRDELGLVPVFLSGPNEVEMVRSIAADAAALAAIDPVLPVGMLKPMIRDSAVVVSTDTGPRHVALAFDPGVVCLMGPNDRRYTDYCLDRQVVIRKDLECSPCQRKVCPLGHRQCMTLITVDEVLDAVRAQLHAS